MDPCGLDASIGDEVLDAIGHPPCWIDATRPPSPSGVVNAGLGLRAFNIAAM
jgi:hypothetical protein